jgi:exosortase
MDRQSGTGNGILEEFRIEFLGCWQQLPSKAFFFVLLAAWLALFQFLGNATMGYISSRSLLFWMYISYNPTVPEEGKDADLGDPHGNLVPFVVLGLLWWKRKELMGVSFRTWWPGLLLLTAGLCLHLLGYAVQQPRISVAGLFTGLYGIMGLAWGPGWLRRSFFPYVLFTFAIPLGSLADPITFRLRLLVCQLVELVSHYILAIDITRVGTKLIDPTGHYEYEVVAACSGIRSLIATLGLAILLGFTSFQTPWKRLAMLASAFPLAVLGNLVRMLTIIIASELGGREAGKVIHEGGPGGVYGLLPYVPAFIGLLLLERYLGGSRSDSTQESLPAVRTLRDSSPAATMEAKAP